MDILVIALSINPRPLSALELKLSGLIMESRVDTAGDNQNAHVIISNYHRMLYLFIRPQFHIAILTYLSSPVITPVEMPCHRMQLLILIRFQCYIILRKKTIITRDYSSLKLYYKRLYHRMLYPFIRPQFHIAILTCLSSPVITPVDKTPGVI